MAYFACSGGEQGGMSMTIAIKRTGSGEFKPYRDGVAVEGWMILNGSHGYSGNDAANTYGIVAPSGKVTWLGPLNTCKKALVRHLEKGVK